MRHGADRHQSQVPGQPYIAGAAEAAGDFACEDRHHFIVPGARVSPPGAEIGKDELVRPIECAHLPDLFGQAPARLVQVCVGVASACVQLTDDSQQRHLEQDGVQPGPADGDRELVVILADLDEPGLQMEQAQKFDEIALEIALRGEEIQILRIHPQRTQLLDLAFQLLSQRPEIDAGRATLEAILHLCARELMQDRLHHRKLVDIGVEQGFDDHCRGSRSAAQSTMCVPAARISSIAVAVVSIAMPRLAARFRTTAKSARRSCNTVDLTQ